MLPFRPIARIIQAIVVPYFLHLVPPVVWADQPPGAISDGPITAELPPSLELSTSHSEVPGLVFLARHRESPDGFPNVNLLRMPGEVRGKSPSDLVDELLYSYRLSGFIDPRLVDTWEFEHPAMRSSGIGLVGRLIEYRNGDALMQSLVVTFPYPDRHYVLTVTATSTLAANEIRSVAGEVLRGLAFIELPAPEAQKTRRLGWLWALFLPLLLLALWAYRSFTNRGKPRYSSSR